ncbi:unnamed protein product [Pleuronectes platessa]|uniref:Uncharacterized protein n=1 Tax=Pleuronectes platessa TaxID=8262 RepID=A0A9N7YIM8_PLEPL|nr:unnamed protein product [Pleuronectes platessa]
MDVLANHSIFQELQLVHDTGYFSAMPSLEENWQQSGGLEPGLKSTHRQTVEMKRLDGRGRGGRGGGGGGEMEELLDSWSEMLQHGDPAIGLQREHDEDRETDEEVRWERKRRKRRRRRRRGGGVVRVVVRDAPAW